MMDFTIETYKLLLKTLLSNKYKFTPVKDYVSNSASKIDNQIVIMRHDVDRKPENALNMANIENDIGVKSTYYFRTKPCSYDKNIINSIEELGHEIGYHYENLVTCNGNFNAAIKDFQENLKKLRNIAKIKTICMHGSPLSKWDNLDLWNHYDYKNFGIIGEAYFDIDFNEFYYLTDTGRRWDGTNFSIRDKVSKNSEFRIDNSELNIKSTQDLIQAAEMNLLPEKIMINIHPQRWTNNPLLWFRELVYQNLKNKFKSALINLNNMNYLFGF